ncbi:helix-turn-helix domain-containing protein [Brevibacterium oceani]|uniref:helix-turn-helix domain-containing protein n=1 Tax=Brevibacterium oceani TaxID=358099 RepID=UPI001B3308D5|nr:helix-turn-helix domain-containing protein [Brevibacterium oceani]
MNMSVPVLRTWMKAVSEISRAVNVADPLDVVLTRIADRARELIGFDFCAVMLSDSSDAQLEIVGWSGLTQDYVGEFRNKGSLQIGPISPEADSPAASAFRSNRTVTISDVRQNVPLYGRLMVSSLMGYNSLVASPLRGERKPIGVLVGYSLPARLYGAADIELTELLAEQTVSAIHTARLRARREWAEQEHRRLMQLVLDEVGLDDLVQSLGNVLNASVAVIENDGKVLAATGNADFTSISKTRRKLNVRPNGELTLITRQVGSDGRDAWVAPVVIAGEVAARLWVIGNDAVPDTTCRRLVEQFALVVGIDIMSTRHALEIEERLSGDLLADVLQEQNTSLPQVLLERGEALGFDLNAASHVILVRGHTIVERLPDVARRIRRLTHVNALATSYRDDVVFLMSETHGSGQGLNRALSELSGTLALPLTVVISPPIHHSSEIRSAYLAAVGAARLRASGGATGIVDLRDFSVLSLLAMADSPTAYHRRLANQLIAPIAEQDDRRSTDLVPTLRTWLASGFSVSRTAGTLTVHVNTVSQRLNRIESLIRRDLKPAATRLDLQLALHVWDIVQTDIPSDCASSRR